MGVVDEAVEDGISISRVADHLMPSSHRQLAGDDGRAATISLLKDFKQVMAGQGIERIETPIVQNQKLYTAKRALELGMPTIAPGERQTGKQLWNALVQDGAIITAGLVGECAGEPTFADACWPVMTKLS